MEQIRIEFVRSIALEYKRYLASISERRPLFLVTKDEYKSASKSTRNTSQAGSDQGLSPADQGKVTPLEMSRQVVLDISSEESCLKLRS